MAEHSSNRRGPRGGGPGGGYIPGEKAKNFRGTARKLIRYIGSYRVTVFLVALFAVGGTISILSAPRCSARPPRSWRAA